jgi:Fe-S-cluster containining protein
MKKDLPCIACGGKCCYFAPIELPVWERVKHLLPKGSVVAHIHEDTKHEAVVACKPLSDGECAFLSLEKRCTIYHMRPKACRAVGGPKVPCQYVDPKGAAEFCERSMAKYAGKTIRN